MSRALDLVSSLNLLPHPEGGFYKETYRSEHSTGIFYLLSEGQKSSLHRIKSDEMWHFYEGDSLVIVEIALDGAVKETLIGANNRQHVLLGGVWFGAYLPTGSKLAFVGCTVAPAFHYQDFEMGNKAALLREYPAASDVINSLLT